MFMEKNVSGNIQTGSMRFNYLFYPWSLIVLFLFTTLFGPSVMAQDETGLRKVITARDTKKLNKADRIIAAADKLSEDATELKAPIRTLQRDSSLSRRAIKRKTRSYEVKSWQKEFQASALYEKGNNLKYSIYKKYLNRFWKDHEAEESGLLNAKVLEEQARDNYAQARVYRKRTRHMNLGSAKIEKLVEAKNLESVAIRRQVNSLSACYSIPETQAEVDAPVARADAEIPAATAKPDTAEKITQTQVLTEPEKVPRQIAKDTTDETAIVLPAVKPEQPVVTVPSPEIKENIVPEDLPAKPELINRVLFRVQIAASRNPLTLPDLAKIYTGKYPVEAVPEAGWLKYQLLGQPMFSEVQKIFREVNIQGAFIVAYKDGVKQNPAEMIKENRELEKRLLAEGNAGMPENTEYHVELKVSKVALKPEEVAKLYRGPEPVSLIIEKGQYAYHLKAGNSSDQAGLLKQKSGIDGAVIVIYRRSMRVE